MIFVAEDSLQNLSGFSKRRNKLEILERTKPEASDSFFEILTRSPFTCAGEVRKQHALIDTTTLMENVVPMNVQRLPFYKVWLDDIAAVVKLYCTIGESNSVRLWLGTNRGCKRYHIDYVPHRLLITYSGKGTEWLPDDAVDKKAYERGEPNEVIVKDATAKKFIDEWNVAIFRGLADGLLHRTPDDALSAPSLLMRLDHPDFGKTSSVNI